MAKINLFDLEKTGIVGNLRGQKIYLYGTNSVGKTYQAMQMFNPFLVAAEPGGNAVDGYKYTTLKWSVFKDVVNQLTSEKTVDGKPEYELMQSKYQTIVLDTIDNLIEYSEQAVCQEKGVRDLSEITGRENGYNISRKDFRFQINKLCSYGYTVVFLGHEEIIEKIDEITGETYKYVQPKGSDNIKSSARYIRDMCDFCFYIKPSGIDENGDTIPSVAICKATKTVFAKSHYPTIQTYIKPFTAKNLEGAIVKAIEKTADIENIAISDWEKDTSGYTKDDWVELIQPYFKTVFKKYPEKVRSVVAAELGEGVKVSNATDEQITELENIYNQLVTFACDQGIVVE